MHMCICTCTVRSNNIIAYSFIEAIKPLDLLMQRKRVFYFFSTSKVCNQSYPYSNQSFINLIFRLPANNNLLRPPTVPETAVRRKHRYSSSNHSPSTHNFSTSVSIFAFMRPTENPIRIKKPTARTAQQWRCEKHPSLKNNACSFV